MRSPRTTSVRIPFGRLVYGLAMIAGLAIAAHAGPAAHASPILQSRAALYDAPHINVNDEWWGPNNPHVYVGGISFTANSTVLIELVNPGGTVVAEGTTTARAPLSEPHAGAFSFRLTTPAGVALPGLRLFAVDRATGQYSNSIAFHQPIPPCIHHPYTCI